MAKIEQDGIPRHLSADELQALEEKFDPEMRFREVARPLAI